LKFKDEFELEIILEDDGTTAIETFKQRNRSYSLKNIHLVFMDLNMNIMNGDKATRQVF
jgi:CheY-like chemotaxis protein